MSDNIFWKPSYKQSPHKDHTIAVIPDCTVLQNISVLLLTSSLITPLVCACFNEQRGNMSWYYLTLMPDDYHLLFLLRLISSWICLIFRLSENSGSYYRHIYLYGMNRTRSANIDRDINLSERKMVLWTIQYNCGKINVGTWLFCFCLISSCSHVCCRSLKAVADRQLNKYETFLQSAWRRQHKCSAKRRTPNTNPPLLPTSRVLPLLNTVRKWQLLHFKRFGNVLMLDAERKFDLQTCHRFSLQGICQSRNMFWKWISRMRDLFWTRNSS